MQSIPGINQIPQNDYIQDDAIQALLDQSKLVPTELISSLNSSKSMNNSLSLNRTKKAFEIFTARTVNIKRANLKYRVVMDLCTLRGLAADIFRGPDDAQMIRCPET